MLHHVGKQRPFRSRRIFLDLRAALGANRASLVRLVLGGTLLQAVGGIVVGVPAALIASRALADQLYRVSPSDTTTFVASALVLLLSAAAAAIVPALRASGVDAVTGLR